jgi:preprotein translocase subunit SecA
MTNRLTSLFDLNSKQISSTEKAFQKIKALKDPVSKMSFEDMQSRIKEMKSEINKLVDQIPFEKKLSLRKIDRTKSLSKDEVQVQAKLNEFLPEVYAFMDEVFYRKVGFRYHDVQLRAGIILAQGQRLVELFTGEGKTMTFQLPLVLYSIAGRGAHLVTVNDYLSRRDGEYAGHIASALGLSLGIVSSTASYKFVFDDQLKFVKGEGAAEQRKALEKIQISNMDGINLVETSKREAYNCDITYGTNNEFGFDYLRDNMSWELSNISQRELYFCVIDEADSILIDEARTPLIISGIPTDANVSRYKSFAEAVKDLNEGDHYEIDHKTRRVALTESGIELIESKLGVDNLWKDYSMAYHIENALKAETMFNKDEHYLVKGGEVLIVDEFTGRILKGRRYSEGLHQAIEAKEGVEVRQESKTYATITFQNFFRLYKVLSGGSGTVLTEAEEFYKIYGLETVQIPTNKPVVRVDSADLIYKNQNAKYKAVVAEIKERHLKGQPVLVGTTSVDKSELISSLLDVEQIPHEVLNAKYHEQEAKIIEKAGRKGAVTVATNMAGRGADIVIGGGSRGDAAYEEIKALGGLHVIGTERHESRRIDNQLRGRTGRQGEPGSSRFYVALDDQLMRILGGDMMGSLMARVGMQEDTPIELKLISKQIESAQKRIEGMNFDARKQIVDYDDVMNQHREIFYSRRRNFLQSAEEASGKLVDNGVVIEVSALNKQDQDKIQDRVTKAQESLIKIIKNLVNTELENFIQLQLSNNRKWSKENTDNITKEFLEIIPTSVVAKTLNLQTSKVSENISENLLNEKMENAKTYLLDLASKIIESKQAEFGKEFYYVAKAITLQTMDNIWVDHLELMKDIRDGIGLQAYAQKDPLVEYKNEAFIVFEGFIQNINKDVVKQILSIQKLTPEIINAQPVLGNTVTNEDQITDINTEDREFLPSSQEKVLASSVVGRIESERRSQAIGNGLGTENNTRKINAKAFKQFNRNDKVSVKYADGRIEKDVKFKKVEQDLLKGTAVIIV